MTTAYICLGSNLGDPENNLNAAAAAVAALADLSVTGASGVYLTEPQGRKEQPWFANQVLRLECGPSFTPQKLLSGLLRIENELGRVRPENEHDAPRVIDIDLLLFGNSLVDSDFCLVPHPRMKQRAFVLVPLLEIAPDLVLPCGASAGKALEALGHSVEGRFIRQ